jgi:LytS/YehU family sensor histidine kinase
VSFVARFVRITAINAVATVVFTAMIGVGWQAPWPQVAQRMGVFLLFATCISTLCWTIAPRVVPLLCTTRFGSPASWAAILALFAALACVGSVIALAILAAIGYVTPAEAVRSFAGSLRLAMVVTLVIGVSISIYESMRARLEAATLALRTKERDEAEARRLAAEAQLASLESRVQPHFLFNTLNSIAELIHRDPSGAERMTGQLATLLRSSLDETAGRTIPLADELAIVRDYLEIERVRYGSRLTFTIDADDEARAAEVPRLSVQTLVENSIKYAVAPRREGARLAIRATARGGRVAVEVEDNGPGFDATAPLPHGHGLSLLRDRLRLSFGSHAALQIDSRAGRTLVIMELPGA